MTDNQWFTANLEECPVHKISERDSNKFVLLSYGEHLPYTNCVEIFDEGGETPPNKHKTAYEHFFIIGGKGLAVVGDDQITFYKGSHIIVPPGYSHQIKNTGKGRLYVFTTMVPDEDFSRLILSGPRASLDDEDLRVLQNDGRSK